ncbi:GNAT family N-acetyltransferase [Gulosibacter sediminis]|uniref:GNAT family N-acetyltransferase n=1 Tax=Gulosibacter sediminis TaxID=1729695 RepID=UPI0024A8577A|nr:GNAT family N-acetyltransferase [Gulosibacter sediminis]
MGEELAATSALDDIRLDPPALGDVQAIHEIYGDPRVWGHLPSGRHTNLETTAAKVSLWIDAWERDGRAAWIVRDATTGAVLGHVGCSVRRGAFWNLGYRLSIEAQGRGIATRVSMVAIRRAKQVDPNLPIVAYLLEHNHASARVAEKCGLTLQHRAPDAGNPDPNAIRLIYADRALSSEQLHAALA